jgi:PAS domain S-box-containing protein
LIELESIRQEALDFAGIGLLRVLADGIVVHADVTALRILDVRDDLATRPTAVAGTRISDLTACPIPIELLAGDLRHSARVRREEVFFQTASGDDRWVQYDCYLVRNPSSNDEFIQFVFQDTSERQRTLQQAHIRQIAVDSSVSAIAMADQHGIVTYANAALASMWGYDGVDDVIGNRVDSFWMDDHLARHVESKLLQHNYWSGQLTARRKNGATFEVHLSATRALNASGVPVCLMLSCVDISEQKRIEEELRKRVETERLVVRISTQLVSRMSRDLDVSVADALAELGRFADAFAAVLVFGDAKTRLVGRVFEWWAHGSGPHFGSLKGMPVSRFSWLTKQLVKGKSALLEGVPDLVSDFVAPSTLHSFPKVGTILAIPVQRKEQITGVITLWRDDAAPKWGEQTENAMRIVGEIIANVMLRREAEDEVLRRVEFERVVTAVSSQFIGTAIEEIDGAITEALRTVGEHLRVDRCYINWISDELGTLLESFEWCAPDVQSFHDVLEGVVLVEAYPWAVGQFSQGESVVLHTLDDLPDEAGRERRLMEKQDIKSLVTVPIMVSRRLIGLFGFETVSSHVRWSDDVVVMATIIGQVFGNAMLRKESEEQRHHLEAQLRHAQKLESLGVLAGGIAHDFNNILMGIIGNAGLAMMELPSNSPVCECIMHIERASQHAAELTSQLLAYAGKGAFNLRPVNLTRIIEDMLHLIETAVSKRAFLSVRLSPELPEIDGDAGQLRQVILNLVTNASDAVETAGGNIRVGTGVMKADHAYLATTYLQEDLGEGQYVFLEIADTGCGIERHLLSRIFDPFFSTKFPGRGLGLAAVLGIARAHHAAIKVDTSPGEGTVFRVLFPCRVHLERTEAPVPTLEPMESSGGIVLVVDDEPVVRRVARLTLERFGFEVVLAEDGREAIEVFRAQKGAVSCVLLDMTMPVMDGAEAYAEIRQIDADVPIILSSGYAEMDARERLNESETLEFIQKPYTTVALVEVVNRVIRQRARRSS